LHIGLDGRRDRKCLQDIIKTHLIEAPQLGGRDEAALDGIQNAEGFVGNRPFYKGFPFFRRLQASEQVAYLAGFDGVKGFDLRFGNQVFFELLHPMKSRLHLSPRNRCDVVSGSLKNFEPRLFCQTKPHRRFHVRVGNESRSPWEIVPNDHEILENRIIDASESRLPPIFQGECQLCAGHAEPVQIMLKIGNGVGSFESQKGRIDFEGHCKFLLKRF